MASADESGAENRFCTRCGRPLRRNSAGNVCLICAADIAPVVPPAPATAAPHADNRPPGSQQPADEPTLISAPPEVQPPFAPPYSTVPSAPSPPSVPLAPSIGSYPIPASQQAAILQDPAPHKLPKCTVCGSIVNWRLGPVISGTDCLISCVLFLLFGAGLIWFTISLIRGLAGNRDKICPQCGSKNCWTFVY